MSDGQFSMGKRRLTPVVKTALIVLGAAFLVLAIAARFPAGAEARDLLILDPTRVLERPWTILTYALVHDLSSPWHIVFNAMVLYFFGPELEERWGKARFVTFLLSAVVGGGILIVLASLIGLGSHPVLGASAACEAAVIVWGLFNRDREVFLYFFPVKGITLVYVTIGFAVLDALTNSGVSAAGHFGGILVGFVWGAAYVGPFRQRLLKRRLAKLQAERDAVVAAARRKGSAAASGLRVIPGGKDSDGKNWLN